MAKKDRTGLKPNGKIDWMHPDNKKCMDLIGWGLSLECIQRETGLSPSRIMYRAKAKDMKIRDFRNGIGPKAVVLLSKFKIKKRGA
jgi:hypothetical protein